MSIEKKEEIVTELKKSLDDALVPSWQAKGITNEQFTTDLKNKLTEVNSLLKSGQGDTSIIKSTISDTLEFLAWSLVAKEITSAKNMIDAHLVKEKVNGSSTKTRIIETK